MEEDKDVMEEGGRTGKRLLQGDMEYVYEAEMEGGGVKANAVT